jgi:hypothetical protein
MMKVTRLVELSLIYKVQEALSRRRSGERPKSADFRTYNLKYNNIQTREIVTVKVNGIVKNTSDYIIDYPNGSITMITALSSSDVIEIDYTYCPVNIYDEGESPQSKDFKYPAIAIYELEREDKPFELGNHKKEMNPTWVFEVWAERGGERNDITDTIMEIFEGSVEVIDYNVEFPINSDGTKNDSFDGTSQIIGHMHCDSINYSKGGSLDIGEKPKFLTEIFADLTINT